MKTRLSKKLRLRLVCGECLHGAIAAAGDHVGRCLQCDDTVTTPFTIHTSSFARSMPA
jgi:hypothetical protein